jgi:hypothetical protein
MAMAAMFGCLTTASSIIAGQPARERQSGARSAWAVPVTAPESGAPIRIWSRFDGVAHKLAWSRFENGRWTSPRVVTFGPGDDMAPVFGTSSAGSFLFWTDGRGRVLYAPFDPEFGRLFAVPRTLPFSAAGRGGPSAEGGTDAPVILGLCDGGATDPCVASGHGGTLPITSQPTSPSPEGGSDAPITLSTGSSGTGGESATTMTAASSLTCSTQVLAFAYGKKVQAVAIDGLGRVTLLGRFVLADDVNPAEATATLGVYYHGRACD